MKLLHRISEDEVIAEFLRAEIDSARFAEGIVRALGDVDVSVIREPDLNDGEQNRIRKQVLGEVRGYGRDASLFENFPDEVEWYAAVMSREELSSVMYIDYSYWNELSRMSRLPGDAAQTIRSGIEIYGVSNDGFLAIGEAIKRCKTFPRLILVACNARSRIVVLEGHARLTGYFLDRERIPAELEVMIGYSERFAAWGVYGAQSADGTKSRPPEGRCAPLRNGLE